MERAEAEFRILSARPSGETDRIKKSLTSTISRFGERDVGGSLFKVDGIPG